MGSINSEAEKSAMFIQRVRHDYIVVKGQK